MGKNREFFWKGALYKVQWSVLKKLRYNGQKCLFLITGTPCTFINAPYNFCEIFIVFVIKFFNCYKDTCLNDLNELEKPSLAQVARMEEATAISEMNSDFKTEIEERERKISAERKIKPEMKPVSVPSPVTNIPDITPQQIQQTKDSPGNPTLKDIPEIVRKLSSENQSVFSTKPEVTHQPIQPEPTQNPAPVRRPSMDKPEIKPLPEPAGKITEPLVDLTESIPLQVPEPKPVAEPVTAQRIEAPTCVPKANSGYSHYNMDSISTVNKNYPIVSISAGSTGSTGSAHIAPPSYSQTVKEINNSQTVPLPVQNQSIPVPNQAVPVPSQSIPAQTQSIPVPNQSVPVGNQPLPSRNQPIQTQSQPIPVQNQSAPVRNQNQPAPVPPQPRVLPVNNQPVPSQKPVDLNRIKPSQSASTGYQKPVQPPVSQQQAYQQHPRASSSIPAGNSKAVGSSFQGHQVAPNPFEYRNSLATRGLDNMASSQHHFPIGNINPLPISKVKPLFISTP